MKKLFRDTEPLPTIVKLMPEATYEEHMEASATVWELFDAVWGLAEKLVKEEHAEKAAQATLIPPVPSPSSPRRAVLRSTH